MHLKRWLTGLIAAPILLGVIYQGGVLFFGLVAAAVVMSMWEYFQMVFPSQVVGQAVVKWAGILNGTLLVWVFYLGSLDWALAITALNLLVLACLSTPLFKQTHAVLDLVQKQIQGLVYIPLLLSFVILIRNEPDGMRWIVLLLAVVFAGDTAALYVGTWLGKHKLCPAVSPGKTIEGSLGGLAANLVVGAVTKHLLLPDLHWGIAVVFFLVVGSAGQIGDLFESQLKRAYNIKDSGGLLPGHGGILDRIDALLFAAPVAYIFKTYIF